MHSDSHKLKVELRHDFENLNPENEQSLYEKQKDFIVVLFTAYSVDGNAEDACY